MVILETRGLFKKVGQGEVINSLIAYQSYPVMWESVDRGNGNWEKVATKVKRMLLIDLWIFKICIENEA